MAFVGLGGDAASQPTFFELVAADRLMPALKAATSYTLAVLAQTRPRLARASAWEDEAAAALGMALDAAALASPTAPGSFADGLYGLRRAVPDPSAPGGVDRGGLSPGARARTVLALAALPYARAKGDALHRRLVAAEARRLREGGGDESGSLRRRLADTITPTPTSTQARLESARAAATAAYIRAYPATIAACEALRLAYQLAYLLDLSPPAAGRRRNGGTTSQTSTPLSLDPPPPYFSPTLHWLGQVIVRVSGSELAAEARAVAAQRDAALVAAQASRAAPLRVGALRARWAAADYARPALILGVFAFKALEWWYSSGEAALGAASGKGPRPPPPPPPLVQPSPDGVPLPTDPAACPLCRRPRTNPALAVPSGYVFCYPCLHAHVLEHGECPVTRVELGVGGVRRLYEAS